MRPPGFALPARITVQAMALLARCDARSAASNVPAHSRSSIGKSIWNGSSRADRGKVCASIEAGGHDNSYHNSGLRQYL
jgi:hypothetical protein